jgi:hypothetical protein
VVAKDDHRGSEEAKLTDLSLSWLGCVVFRSS